MLEVPPDAEARKSWMGTMARAPQGRLAALIKAAGLPFAFSWLRQPEIGSVMIRGRAGGSGAPFNLGEMTVTRCTLQLDNGPVGHGYVQGRDKDDAEAAAIMDALLQTELADTARRAVLAPLETEERERRTTRARKAAATKVEFFTLVRGQA